MLCHERDKLECFVTFREGATALILLTLQGVQKISGENLKVAWAEFSTIS